MKTATHYYIYVGHETNTKNKLQKDFRDYLKLLEGTLIDAIQLQVLKIEIVEAVQKLNDHYNRCSPILVSFESLHSNKGFRINGFHFLTFQILEAYYANN